MSSVADGLYFPAKPVNLTVLTYYIYGCKYPALNISWEIRLDGKLKYIGIKLCW